MFTPHGNPLGGRRSQRDDRDYRFSQHPRAMAMLEQPVARLADHRATLPAPWDQGQIGSCEAHGVPRAAIPYWWKTMPTFMPSRLAAYAWARQKGGILLANDTGCFTRDMLKVMVDGLYDEQVWPYDTMKVGMLPPEAQRVFKISGYTQIAGQDQLLRYINAGGCAPFAMELPDYFEMAGSDGFIRPYNGEKLIGGHCMCIVGYDLDTYGMPMAIVCNSWGSSWGDKGHCYIPISMILGNTLGGDCWSVFRSDNL